MYATVPTASKRDIFRYFRRQLPSVVVGPIPMPGYILYPLENGWPCDDNGRCITMQEARERNRR